MTQFAADYFDGKSSRRTPVTVRLASDRLVFDADGGQVELPVSAVKVQPRIGGTPRRLELPGGGLLVTQDLAEIEAVFGTPSHTLAHRLESNLPFMLSSLAALVVIFWTGYQVRHSLGGEGSLVALAYQHRIATGPGGAEVARRLRHGAQRHRRRATQGSHRDVRGAARRGGPAREHRPGIPRRRLHRSQCHGPARRHGAGH